MLQDYHSAVIRYEKAAKQGYTRAQTNLGVMNEYGQFVLKDPIYAHMWYDSAAAASGDSGWGVFDIKTPVMDNAGLLHCYQEIFGVCHVPALGRADIC